MKEIPLIQKIQNLPSSIQQQVEDYIDFLMERYQVGQVETKEDTLNEKEKEELLRRYAKWKSDPSIGISLEEAKNQLMQKYAK